MEPGRMPGLFVFYEDLELEILEVVSDRTGVLGCSLVWLGFGEV